MPRLAHIRQALIIITGGNSWRRDDFRSEWRTAGAHSSKLCCYLTSASFFPLLPFCHLFFLLSSPFFNLNHLLPPCWGRKSMKGRVDLSLRKNCGGVFMALGLFLSLLIFCQNGKAALRYLLFRYSLKCRKYAGCRLCDGVQRNSEHTWHTKKQKNRSSQSLSLFIRRTARIEEKLL